MTSATETDLAALRSLAEEGRHTPLAGGRFLVLFGALVPVANTGFWALGQMAEVNRALWLGALIGFMMLSGIAGGMLTKSLKDRPASQTVLAKAEALVWGIGGLALGVYTGMLVLRGLLGLETPPIVMGNIATVAFLIYGIAFFTTAGLSRQKWLSIPGYGSFVAAIVTGLIADIRHASVVGLHCSAGLGARHHPDARRAGCVMDGFDPAGLDDAIHGKVRLAIMAFLSGADSASFPALRAATGTTDGNLSVHLRKLEEAGHILIDKAFEGRKPVTTVHLSPSGREAWIGYLDQLALLLAAQRQPH
jgi:DNA-binding transcriptional ArsR family regulator